jgi:carbon monoxide dehydrogenase subunit G
VKLQGAWTLPAPPEQAYALLQDPAVLARSMPGCEGLERTGENLYAMKMKMVLASITGRFDGKVRIAESNPPDSFRLIVEGSGRIGFMKGDGLLRIAPADAGSTVTYEGDVQVGGTIANVGQRLIETTAKMLIKRFFEKVNGEAAPSAGTAV